MDLIKKPVTIGIAIVLLVVALISAGVYFSNKKDEPLARADSVKVEVDRVRIGSLTRKLTVVGTLNANNHVAMKAQVRGLISKVHVQGGETVEKGDLLFEIDDRMYKATLKEAEAALTLTTATFERAKSLSERNFGTTKSLEEARAAMLRSEAGVDKAQKELDDTKIVAPFEGKVGLHNISEGTPISADLDLITITDVDPIKVSFNVPSKFIPYLSLDQRVKLEVDSYPNKKFEGRIEGIDSMVDVGAQSIAVKAHVDNSDGLLKPGMFVRVNVIVGSKDNSLIVPEEAVVVSGEQSYIWKVIGGDGDYVGRYFAFRVQVLTGIQEKDRIEIAKNANEGDIIITVGYLKVADGVPVNFDLASVGLEKKPAEEVKEEEKSEEKAEESKEESDAEKDTDDKKDEESVEEKESADKKEAELATEPSVSILDKIKGWFSSSKTDEPAAKEEVKGDENTDETSDASANKSQSNDSGDTEATEKDKEDVKDESSDAGTDAAPDVADESKEETKDETPDAAKEDSGDAKEERKEDNN